MTRTIAISKTSFLRLSIVLPALAFTIPFAVSGPQLLTGTLVNCFLFLFVSNLPKKNILPIVILPSMGALLHGVVFGPFTPFLALFLPFIWLGNYMLINTFQKLSHRQFLIRVFVSSVAKSALLFFLAQIYFGFHLVPRLFMTSMETIQLITALSGGLLSLSITTLLRPYERS